MRQKTVYLLVAAILVGACGNEAEAPADAQRTYGDSVDATEAIPAPAVAAEPDRYLGRRITVDGRFVGVGNKGCTIDLDTDGDTPLRIVSTRTTDGSCMWQVPTNRKGIAAATGTLRVDGDTLRLSANGVEVTPVQVVNSDS